MQTRQKEIQHLTCCALHSFLCFCYEMSPAVANYTHRAEGTPPKTDHYGGAQGLWRCPSSKQQHAAAV